MVIRTGKRGRPPTVPMPHEAATFRELSERLRSTRSGSSAPRLSRLPPMRTARAAARCAAPGWRQRWLPRTPNCSVARLDDGGAGHPQCFAQELEGHADDRLADGEDGAPLMSPPSGARSLSCTAEATGWLTSSTPITPPSSYRARTWSSSMTSAIPALRPRSCPRSAPSCSAIAARAHAGPRVVRNPTLRWLPSQNGLLADAPHRHSATRVSCLTSVWS